MSECQARCADLRARISWADSVLGELDLTLLALFAERLAELAGHPPVAPKRDEAA